MKNIYEDFEAELRLNNEFLADGTASVDLDTKSVTFTSGFVPLYELETKVEVIRIHNKQEIHRFEGEVYLSDKNLMRIVSVKDELLKGSQDCYSCNVTCAGSLVANFNNGDKKADALKGMEFDVTIVSMTDEKITFDVIKCNAGTNIIQKLFKKGGDLNKEVQKIEVDQIFNMQKTTILPIANLNVQIKKAYHFGEIPRFDCDIVNTLEPEKELLKEFLWDYNLKNNKLF